MQVQLLQERIDALYQNAFQGIDMHMEGKEELEGFDLLKLQNLSEAAFGQLGRTEPKVSRSHAVRSVTTAVGTLHILMQTDLPRHSGAVE